ncbi:MAG: hypothetical protein ACM31G_03800 [Flavobacteriales bacterium]
MRLYQSDRFRFIAGLVLIVIIYSLYYIYFVENQEFISKSKLVLHLIRLSTTVIIYIIGTIHLGKLKDNWMSSLWHFIHISGLCIITSLGLINWFIIDIGLDLKEFAYTIQELLISPVLYVAMGLLNNSLNKKTVTDNP